MAKLLLIKHSTSNANPDQPAHTWGLTQEGVQRARVLATHIQPFAPTQLSSSTMPKALHTAQLVSQQLDDLPIVQNPHLGEHSRKSNAPYFESIEEFQNTIKHMFDQPNDLIYGDETAYQARDRFIHGIEQIVRSTSPEENIAVVAHGTVNMLFTAKHNDIDTYALWARLKLPSIIILNLPAFALESVIEDAGIA